MDSVDLRSWFPTWADLKRAPAMALLERAAFWAFDFVVAFVGTVIAHRLGTPSMTGFGAVLLVFALLFILAALALLILSWLASRTNWSRTFSPATASHEGQPMGNGNRNIQIGGANYGPINQGDITIGPVPPELKFNGQKDTENADGTRTSTISLEVVSPYVTAQRLQIFAMGLGIKSMDVTPIKREPGFHEFSLTRAERDDGRMFLIDNPNGHYAVTIVADTAAKIEFAARFK